MRLSASGIPRVIVLLGALAAFCLLSPETLSRGPDLCLWRNLFHLSACPACGTARALAAFFHGRFAEALAFNLNVVITAPGLLALLAFEAVYAFRSVQCSPRSSLNSRLELTRV